MTCPACELAKTQYTGRYSADCDSCKVRAIANGQELFDALQAQKITPAYKAVLKKAFGDGWEAGHERVKQWRMSRKETK